MALSAYDIAKNQYIGRLGRVIDHVREHYAEDVRVEELAEIACFSKYHFQRVFRDLFGETVHDYIQRIRLEKAASRLVFDDPSSITEIALDCGFSGSQHFARAFKERFQCTPNCVRRGPRRETVLGRIGVFRSASEIREPTLRLEIVQMPIRRVAYVRTKEHLGSRTEIRQAMSRISRWSAGKEILELILIGAAWRDPGWKEDFVYDACIRIPWELAGAGEIAIQNLPGGIYAVYHGRIRTTEVLTRTWRKLIQGWLSSSWYPRDERPFYEIYYNDGEANPLKEWIVDLCLPIAICPTARIETKRAESGKT